MAEECAPPAREKLPAAGALLTAAIIQAQALGQRVDTGVSSEARREQTASRLGSLALLCLSRTIEDMASLFAAHCCNDQRTVDHMILLGLSSFAGNPPRNLLVV